MFEAFATTEGWVSLITLASLEIVLGIDNIVFISILTDKLPPAEQAKTRQMGLGFALITRLLPLFAISWIMGATGTLFSVLGHDFSGRHLILLGGGLFLIGKSTFEIYENLEHQRPHGDSSAPKRSKFLILAQIMVLDIVFSFDSVITAVGMAKHIIIMAVAMIIAVLVMLTFANPVGNFVNRHPSMKILALAFLLLIGVLLTAEAFDQHIPKGYIYFAMAFSLGVELLNMRVRKARPVPLHMRYTEPGEKPS